MAAVSNTNFMNDSTISNLTKSLATSVPSETNFELIPHNGLWGIICTITIQFIVVGAASFLIFIICRMREQSTTNLLILNQTVADLFNGVVFVSLAVAHYVRPSYVIYNVMPFINIYIVLLSLFAVLTLALHRYWRCKNPLNNHRPRGSPTLCAKGWILKVVMLNWLIPFLISILPLTWSKLPPLKQMAINGIFGKFVWVLLLCLYAALTVVQLLILRIVRDQLKPKFNKNYQSSSYRTTLKGEMRSLPSDVDKRVSTASPTPCRSPETSTMQSRTSVLSMESNSVKHTGERLLVSVEFQQHKKSQQKELLETCLRERHFENKNEKLRRIARCPKRQKREIRIERLLGALMVSLFTSYFPIVLINFVYLFQINFQLPDWIQTVSFYTFIFNSAANPLLCIFMKRDLFNKAKHYTKRVCLNFKKC